MTRLEIILSAALTVSVIANIGLLMYARYAIIQLLSVSEEIGDLHEMVNSFASHLNSIYELEMFYGDETIKGLLEHSLSFVEQLETFEYIYSLTEEGEELVDKTIDKTTEEEAE
tara:strand:+ start:2372 stop:2713 length:342 start_codon:yes stop_codon:yes gene_type:complete